MGILVLIRRTAIWKWWIWFRRFLSKTWSKENKVSI